MKGLGRWSKRYVNVVEHDLIANNDAVGSSGDA